MKKLIYFLMSLLFLACRKTNPTVNKQDLEIKTFEIRQTENNIYNAGKIKKTFAPLLLLSLLDTLIIDVPSTADLKRIVPHIVLNDPKIILRPPLGTPIDLTENFTYNLQKNGTTRSITIKPNRVNTDASLNVSILDCSDCEKFVNEKTNEIFIESIKTQIKINL